MDTKYLVTISIAFTIGIITLLLVFFFGVERDNVPSTTSAFENYYVTFEGKIELTQDPDNSEEVMQSNQEVIADIFEGLESIHYSINSEIKTIPSFTVQLDSKGFEHVSDSSAVSSIEIQTTQN